MPVTLAAAMIDRVLVGIATAGTIMGMALVTVGQAIIDPAASAIERYAGGSILLVAAILIVKWTFNLITVVRDNADADRKANLERSRQDHAASLEREQMLHGQVATLVEQLSELNAQLATERALRVSLERAGIQDRRHPEDQE